MPSAARSLPGALRIGSGPLGNKEPLSSLSAVTVALSVDGSDDSGKSGHGGEKPEYTLLKQVCGRH